MPDQEPEEGFTIRDRRLSAEPEESFTIRDRRHSAEPRVATVETVAPPAPAEGDMADHQSADEPEGTEGDMGDPNALPDVYSILALFMGELRNIAWLRMGLVANPATGEFETDMEQAKVAINTVGFLASQLEPVIAPEEKLPLRALVSDLQLNFAQQAKRSGV